jgi:nifR3 family TIM-barrel protein
MIFKPQKLGNLILNPPLTLAPLAGVSDSAFRLLNQEFGASLTYVEMLSSIAIKYRNKKTLSLLEKNPKEAVVGVQITGSQPEDFKEAVSYLDKLDFQTIDLNLGCPVRKVVHSGCGAALMKDLSTLKMIFEVCRQETKKPLTAKFRLGWTRNEINATEVADLAFQSGFNGITLHGRTRSERYNTPVDHSAIQDVFEKFQNQPSFLCFGNGDVFSHQDHQKMLSSNADGVMVSRGALGNPWIFRELQEQKKQEPTIEEWADVVFKHLSYHENLYGNEEKASKLMRKHLIWYANGFPGIKAIRQKLGLITSIEEAREIIKSYQKTLPSSTQRNTGCCLNQKTYDPKTNTEIEY